MKQTQNSEDIDEIEDLIEDKIYVAERKKNKITIPLIMQCSIETNRSDYNEKKNDIEFICNMKAIHLEWLGIEKIENLNLFTNLRILYLQYNFIAKIENLDFLINLEFLALNGNQITNVENLKNLKNLTHLNLSENLIQTINPGQFPTSLQYLILHENPFYDTQLNWRKDIVLNLPNIIEIDKDIISAEEKFKYMGIFPKHLEEYAENVKTKAEDEDFDHDFEPMTNLYENLVVEEKSLLKEALDSKEQLRKKTNEILEKSERNFFQKNELLLKETKAIEQIYKKMIKIYKSRAKFTKIEELEEEQNPQEDE